MQVRCFLLIQLLYKKTVDCTSEYIISGSDEGSIKIYSLISGKKEIENLKALDLNICSIVQHNNIIAVRSISGLIGLFELNLKVFLQENEINSNKIF